MDINLIKTIIHESGHFFSAECQANLYSENIFIKKNKNDYVGYYNPKTSDYIQDSKIVPLENLPHYVIRIISGCIFESIYLNNHFSNCFNNKSNGSADYFHFNYHLDYHRKNKPELLPIITKYIDNLKRSNIIKDFESKIIIEDLLSTNDGIILEVNLDKLRTLFDQNKYYEIYTETLAELENTLNPEK